MATGMWLLATVYKFTREGEKELIHNFHASVQNPSVRCLYDSEQDMFQIDCPASLGDRPYRQFATLMDMYVKQNLSSPDLRKVFRLIESQPSNELDLLFAEYENLISGDAQSAVNQDDLLLDLGNAAEDEDETGYSWNPAHSTTDVVKVFSHAVIETVIQDTGCALNVEVERRSVTIKGIAQLHAARKLSNIERNAHRNKVSSHIVHTENLPDVLISVAKLLENPYDMLLHTLVQDSLRDKLPGLRTCRLVRFDEWSNKLEILLNKPTSPGRTAAIELVETWADLRFLALGPTAGSNASRVSSHAGTVASATISSQLRIASSHGGTIASVPHEPSPRVRKSRFDLPPPQVMVEGTSVPAGRSVRVRPSRFDVPPPQVMAEEEIVPVGPSVRARKSRFDVPPPAREESTTGSVGGAFADLLCLGETVHGDQRASDLISSELSGDMIPKRQAPDLLTPEAAVPLVLPITMTTEDPTLSQRTENILQWASTVPESNVAVDEVDEFSERLQVISEPETRRLYKTRLQKGKSGKSTKGKKPSQVDTSGLPRPDPLPEPQRRVAQPKLDDQAVPKPRKSPDASGAVSDMLQILEHARSIKGEMQIQVQLGQILLETNGLKSTMKQEVFEAQVASQQANGGIQVHFNRRLTTDVSEACLLVMPHAFSEPFLCETFYQFVLLDKENKEVRLDVAPTMRDQHTVKDVSISSMSQEVGSVYLHYPRRVHDARFIVSQCDEYHVSEAMQMFVDTIEVEILAEEMLMDFGDGPAAQIPRVKWRAESNEMSVQSVCAKRRVHHRHVKGDFTLQVTESRLLEQAEHKLDPKAKAALSSPIAAMIDDQRLWFEASLHVNPSPLLEQNKNLQLGDDADWKPEDVLKEETTDDLRTVTAQLMRLDAVGLNNHGPRGNKLDLLDIEARLEARRQEKSGRMEAPVW